jgi:hypothetical protein
MKRSYVTRYGDATERYNEAFSAWQRRVDDHNRREQERFGSSLLWYPVQLTSRPNRIDVFGGTEDGWASLLMTIGTTQLATGSSIFLLDFTDMPWGTTSRSRPPGRLRRGGP